MHASPLVRNESNLHAWLPEDVRDQLAAVEEQAIVPASTRLIDHNTAPTHLVILNSGTAEISLQAQGRSLSLGTAGSGSVFDLRALVCGVMPSIDVICREECRITLVPREVFTRVLKENPKAYFAVAKVLSADLKTANDALRRLLSTPTRGFRRIKAGAAPSVLSH